MLRSYCPHCIDDMVICSQSSPLLYFLIVIHSSFEMKNSVIFYLAAVCGHILLLIWMEHSNIKILWGNKIKRQYFLKRHGPDYQMKRNMINPVMEIFIPPYYGGLTIQYLQLDSWKATRGYVNSWSGVLQICVNLHSNLFSFGNVKNKLTI